MNVARKMRLTRINQSFDPAFAHGGQLVDPDGQVVGGLGGVLAVKVSGGDELAAFGENELPTEKIVIIFTERSTSCLAVLRPF
jgi:hypothetical protein